MKIFDLMQKVKVKKIGVRLCNSVEDAKKKRYEGTTIKYWDDLDDMPAEYASYQIITLKVKSDTLFCWCVEDSLKVKDILDVEVANRNKYLTFFNYISEYDAKTKNHEHTIPISNLKGIEDCEVVDSVIECDRVYIFVFKNNIRSNIFEKSFDEKLEFREI